MWLDANMDVGSLTLLGSLLWDTTQDGLVLRSGFVVVEGAQALFQIGTPASPMLNRATVYIKGNGIEHQTLGRRVFGIAWISGRGVGDGPSLRIHGRPLRRTWSLLVQGAAAGSQTLRVEGDLASVDPNVPGGGSWRVGERIGLAPTGLPVTAQAGRFGGEVFSIVSIRAEQWQGMTTTVIGLSASLAEARLGDVARRMQAEVVHLTRTVLLTGDDFTAEGYGLHGIAAWGQFAPARGVGGTFRFEYARVEKCGQRGIKGRYCLHYHMMGDCGPDANGEPRCLIRGAALEDSSQRGIVVHSTHRSLVDRNILWNVRGAGIYVEDGNEMGNIIRENVNICPDNSWGREGCKAKGTDNDQADDIQQSGMWALSVTNDFLFNRMVNHYNGFFTQTSAFPMGKGAAEGKVCTTHAPFGNFTGNVHHTNFRFGFYLDNNLPRRLRRSIETNGFVVDIAAYTDNDPNTWSSCDGFTPDGRDNGAPGVVADGLDWGNTFVGQYELGDVQYLRYRGANNLHSMYWKQTKNFATAAQAAGETWDLGGRTAPAALGKDWPIAHLKDCVFVFYTDGDLLQVLGAPAMGVAMVFGPGGHGAFVVQNTTFSGTVGVALAANQHCGIGPGTGGLCTPEYELIDVDFSGIPKGNKAIQFGASGGDDRLPMFSTATAGSASLAGYRAAASRYQAHLLQLRDPSTGAALCRNASAVSADLAARFDGGILCDRPLRRLQLWSPRQSSGAPRLSVVGGTGAPQEMMWVDPPNGGEESTTKRGYGLIIMAGFNYTLDNLEALPGRASGTTLEFSDAVYGDALGRADAATLTLRTQGGSTRTCRVTSQHDRRFIAQAGPLQAGFGGCLTDGAESSTTEPPLSAPWVPPAPTTASTTVAPTPGPPPSPTPAGSCAALVCTHRTSWPTAMSTCNGSALEGTVIRTDRSLDVCRDCAERCWLQMSTCVGFSMQITTGDAGDCTYYSAVTRVVGAAGGSTRRAIVSASVLATPAPDPVPSPAPPPATPAPSSTCTSTTCTNRNNWPYAMQTCPGGTLVGTAIRTDRSLHICNDCAERCWMQMSNCVGVTMQMTNGDYGDCTYFSAATALVWPANSNTRSIMTRTLFATLAATTTSTTPTPTSTPLVSGQGCTNLTCPHRSSWPALLNTCPGTSLQGTIIRTDYGVQLCTDCAERCWFQMSTCVGFVLDADSPGGDRGACTYFSAVTGAGASPTSNRRAVVALSQLRLLMPAPAPTPAPTPRPLPSMDQAQPTVAPAAQVCPERTWPSPIYINDQQTVQGVAIRTDGGVLLCLDCAQRCWLQMGNCIGFSFSRVDPLFTDGPGLCTYYSEVWNVTAAPPGTGGQWVSTAAYLPTTSAPVGSAAPQRPSIKIAGRQLLVNGVPFHIKGVNWNPIPRGGTHPANLDFVGLVDRDSSLMQAANINAIRTYEPLTDKGVLDKLWAKGIFVLSTVYPWGGASMDSISTYVQAVIDHPAILMWVVGNEWNYNGLYYSLSPEEAKSQVQRAARAVKAIDGNRPVATMYGEIPTKEVIASLPEIDVWGINAYRGIDFGDLFSVWAGRSTAPMFLGEYGADAWDARSGSENQDAQAQATTVLTGQINNHSSVYPGGVCIGGLLFEFADEWWKDSKGSPSVHDVGGIAPGGGPYPDSTFNEEWWGIVDIDRNPRKAYNAFAAMPVPRPPAMTTTTALPQPKTTRAPSEYDFSVYIVMNGANADKLLANRSLVDAFDRAVDQVLIANVGNLVSLTSPTSASRDPLSSGVAFASMLSTDSSDNSGTLVSTWPQTRPTIQQGIAAKVNGLDGVRSVANGVITVDRIELTLRDPHFVNWVPRIASRLWRLTLFASAMRLFC